MSTTVENLRAVIDRLEDAGIPLDRVELAWHHLSDETVQQVVGLFPDRAWLARAVGGYEWVATDDGGVQITTFLESYEREATNARGKHVIASARAEQAVRS